MRSLLGTVWTSIGRLGLPVSIDLYAVATSTMIITAPTVALMDFRTNCMDAEKHKLFESGFLIVFWDSLEEVPYDRFVKYLIHSYYIICLLLLNMHFDLASIIIIEANAQAPCFRKSLLWSQTTSIGFLWEQTLLRNPLSNK